MIICQKNKKIFKRIFAGLTLSFLVFGNASAGLFDMSPGEVMDEVETRYGFDQNIMRRAKQKANYPQVEIYFDATNPKQGDQITATAVPTNFRNSNEDLYFTWFLLRKDDDLNDKDLMDKIARRTMGMVARGSYDPSLFATDYSDTGSDPDNDGFEAPIGGNDGVGAIEDKEINSEIFEEDCYSDTARQLVDSSCITRCYLHNFGLKFKSESEEDNSGRDKIIECKHKFPEPEYGKKIEIKYEDTEWEREGETTSKIFSCGRDENGNEYEIGDGDFTTGEEICWGTDPENADTDGDGIVDEADLAGLAQEEFNWTYQEGDKIGVWVEGISTVAINEGSSQYSPYYKITWASTGICSSKDDNFIEGDGCDDDEDFGFPFVDFKEIIEEKEQNIEASLSFSPTNPQMDLLDEELTSTIKVNGMIQSQGKNEGNSYFEWEIYKCQEGDTENCSRTGEWLTKECKHGDQMGDCAKTNGKKAFESNSYVQGAGASEISFKPQKELFTSSNNKEYLKVYLKIKRYKTDAKFTLSNITIPIAKSDFKIKFFEVSEQEDGLYGFKDEDEICNTGLYKTLCPLFPRQIIGAKVEFADNSKYESDKTVYSWKINDLDVGLPNECEMFKGSEGDLCSQTSQDNIIYFPIKEVDNENSVNAITASVKLINGEKETDLTSTRAYVIDNPVAIITSENQDTAWPTILHDGTTDDSFFETEPGNKVTFKAEIVPDYLKIGEDIDLTWTLDGMEITEELINSEENKELGISLEDNKISFNILGKVGNGSQLSANLYMPFGSDQLVLLQKNWNISDSNPIENTSSIGIKRVYVPDEESEETASLKMFLASTVKNAPEYLIFILRLAIVLTIIWGVVFGADYLIKPRKL